MTNTLLKDNTSEYIFRAPYLTNSNFIILLLGTILFYRFLRIFIAIQSLISVDLLTIVYLDLVFDILSVVLISIILLYQRSLNTFLYFGLLGITLISLINIFSFQSEFFNPLKSTLEDITIIGSIILIFSLIIRNKNNFTAQVYKKYLVFAICYCLALFFSSFLEYFQYLNEFSTLINISVVILVLALGIIAIISITRSFSNIKIPLVGMIIGTIIGVGFGFSLGKGDLRRLIVRSIFSESTSVELGSISDIDLNFVSIDFDFILIISSAIIYAIFIVLVISSFFNKTKNSEYLMLLVMSGLIGLESVIPILLLLRLFVISEMILFIGRDEIRLSHSFS